jgi:hypothetical protein
MTLDQNAFDEIQFRAQEDDWVTFNRYFFLKCAADDKAMAAQIAAKRLSYEVDRWFNYYTRALKRLRKQGHKTLVLLCDNEFNLMFSDQYLNTISQNPHLVYKFYELEELSKHSDLESAKLFLLARMVSCFADLAVRKKSDDLAKSIGFTCFQNALELPRESRIFIRTPGDPFAGHDDMKDKTHRLFEAVAGNDIDQLWQMLDSGIDINTKSLSGESLLYEALDRMYYDLALQLVKRGIKFNKRQLAKTLRTWPPDPDNAEEQSTYDQLLNFT